MKKAISGLSCAVTVDSRVDKAGRSKIILRIRENRVKRDLSTRIWWPRELFDLKNQLLIPRYPDDPDVIPFNLRLNEYKAVAHRLQLSGYLKKDDVTIDDLVKEFKDVGKGNDFFTFMESAARELYNDDIIVAGTYNRHKSTLHTLQLYYRSTSLPINKFNLELIQRFDAWCKRVHKRSHNTVCGYHKDLKKYLGIALRKCIIGKNPYEDFSFAYVDGDREALTREEVNRLFELYHKPQLKENEKQVLRRFLFSCVTGLRVSDTSLVDSTMIIDGVLTFIPFKGRVKGRKLKIPLPKIAMRLIEGRRGRLFTDFSHPYINETLKIIAARADIYKRLTTHCARDTFGTLFIEMKGDVKSLSEIMGHSSTKTTMIYVKMTDKRKADLMGNFDLMFGEH
jgi:integrase